MEGSQAGVEDHAVLVQHHRGGVGHLEAQGREEGTVDGICALVILGEDDVAAGIMIGNEGGGSVDALGGVDGDDGQLIGIAAGHFVKVGKFRHTGAAPGAPEIDDGHFSRGSRINGLGGDATGGDDLQVEAGGQVTHLVAHHRARRACAGRIRGITGRGRGRSGVQIHIGIPVVGQCADEGDLQHEDHGDTHHEGHVLGLVADEQHGDIHGQRTAHGRPDEQGFLGNEELDVVPLGDLFVVDTDHDGADGDHDDVGEENQPEQRDRQIMHGDSPFCIAGRM